MNNNFLEGAVVARRPRALLCGISTVRPVLLVYFVSILL